MATARSINVHLRLKPREVKMWRAAAKRADATLSEWIRNLCNSASLPTPPSVPPTVSGDQVELPFQALPRTVRGPRGRVAVVSVDELADRGQNGKRR